MPYYTGGHQNQGAHQFQGMAPPNYYQQQQEYTMPPNNNMSFSSAVNFENQAPHPYATGVQQDHSYADFPIDPSILNPDQQDFSQSFNVDESFDETEKRDMFPDQSTWEPAAKRHKGN